jgi:outer membrane protein assembly factor BamB
MKEHLNHIHMKKKLPSLIICVLCISLNISAQQDTIQRWQHFGSDNGYTSFSKNEHLVTNTNVKLLKRSWGLGCDDGMFSVISRTPAFLNDNLFIASAGGKLESYNAINGEFNWDFGTANDGWAKQPSVSSDTIVYYLQGSWPSYLYAVDGKNGKMLWKAPRGFSLYFDDKNIITVDEASNQIFLMDQDPNTLYAIDRFTGKINWTFNENSDTLGLLYQTYVPVSNNKILLVERKNGSNNRLLEISTTNPTIRKEYPWVSFNALSTILATDTLASLSYDNADSSGVMIFNRKTSGMLYHLKVPSKITGSLAYNPKSNILYIPTNPNLYAYNLSTGNLKWKYTVPSYDDIYTPSIANGIIYFISNINMWAIDEETKTDLFQFDLGGTGYEKSQVAIYKGRLYFSGNGNTCDFFCLGFNVPKQDQTITFNPLSTKTYGDADFIPGASASSKLAVSYKSSNINVASILNEKIHITGSGSTSITASQEGDTAYNAAIDMTQVLFVDKKELTATADNKTRKFGETNPEFTISYNGFVNGENKTVIDVKPIASCSENTTSIAGDYDITVSGGIDNNYDFNYINGKLTIQPITEISELAGLKFEIYPNPAKDKLYIQTIDGGSAILHINNLEGSEILCKTLINPIECIDITGIPKGLYILNITTSVKNMIYKVLIQ